MGVKYNPFAGNLDIVDSPSGDFSDIEISGDLTLGTGTPVTTVQAVTPTANRTISFPDQSGTVALVAGATGAIQYNESGAQTGTVDFAVDPDWNNASTTFTGLKLNVTDTASASGSNLVDIQSNGTSKVVVNSAGNVLIGSSTDGGSGALQVTGTGRIGGFDFGNTSNHLTWVNGSDLTIGTVYNNALAFKTNNTERARIKNNGTINFSNVSVYADNAAALAGGLVAGDVYRTSTGQLMITY